MKILVTGANGQLGTELKKIITKGYSELGSIPEPVLKASLRCIDFEQLDIVNTKDVFDYIGSLSPDVIINCAAYTNVDGCETNRDTAFAVNALGPRNLALAAQQSGAKLLHVSTDYVFAGNGTKAYCEWDICNPQSIYGHTKRLGEEYVKEFCTRYFIVRTSWLYGYIGSNFVKTIMKIAKERGELKVVNDQSGNPTNAADLAHHILKIIATDEYGIYHCTGNGECSWYDFAREIIKLSKINCTVTPCTTEEFPSPTKRPAYSSLDNMMLRLTVGDEMRPWRDALDCFIKNYNESGIQQ